MAHERNSCKCCRCIPYQVAQKLQNLIQQSAVRKTEEDAGVLNNRTEQQNLYWVDTGVSLLLFGRVRIALCIPVFLNNTQHHSFISDFEKEGLLC